jgi:hypothetical protein
VLHSSGWKKKSSSVLRTVGGKFLAARSLYQIALRDIPEDSKCNIQM